MPLLLFSFPGPIGKVQLPSTVALPPPPPFFSFFPSLFLKQLADFRRKACWRFARSAIPPFFSPFPSLNPMSDYRLPTGWPPFYPPPLLFSPPFPSSDQRGNKAVRISQPSYLPFFFLIRCSRRVLIRKINHTCTGLFCFSALRLFSPPSFSFSLFSYNEVMLGELPPMPLVFPLFSLRLNTGDLDGAAAFFPLSSSTIAIVRKFPEA